MLDRAEHKNNNKRLNEEIYNEQVADNDDINKNDAHREIASSYHMSSDLENNIHAQDDEGVQEEIALGFSKEERDALIQDETIGLGDLLRGERATKGKSLKDVQDELKIRADTLQAIEELNLDGISSKGFLSGYVKSYARYLDLDAEKTFERFCKESGFSASNNTEFGQSSLSSKKKQASFHRGVNFDLQSPYKLEKPKWYHQVSLGAIMSVFALLIVVVAISLVGAFFFKQVQKIHFAPVASTAELQETTSSVNDLSLSPAPSELENNALEIADVQPPNVDIKALSKPNLIGLYSDDILESAETKFDGPIGLLPPASNPADIYSSFGTTLPSIIHKDKVKKESSITPLQALNNGELPSNIQMVSARPNEIEFTEEELKLNPNRIDWENEVILPHITALRSIAPPHVKISVTGDAWVKIDAEGKEIFQDILKSEDVFDIPKDASNVILNVGNAGAVFIHIDDMKFGPVGDRGKVVKNVSLALEDISSRFDIIEFKETALSVQINESKTEFESEYSIENGL